MSNSNKKYVCLYELEIVMVVIWSYTWKKNLNMEFSVMKLFKYGKHSIGFIGFQMEHLHIKLKVRPPLLNEHWSKFKDTMKHPVPSHGNVKKWNLLQLEMSTQFFIFVAYTHHSWGYKRFIHDLMLLVRNLQFLLFF